MSVANPSSLIAIEAGLIQILTKADTELATLESESIALSRQIDAAQAELDAITSRQGARFQSLQMAEKTVSQLKADLATAQARTRLAENTLASESGESVKDLEKRLQRAESDLSKLRAKLSKESQVDSQRESAVQKTLHQAHTSLDAIGKSEQATRAAREQAFEELGKIIQRVIVQRLQALRENIEVRRAALAKAEQEVDDFSREARETLLAWPGLLQEIQPSLSYRDSSTAVLEAATAFLNVCLTQGKDSANIDSNVFRNSGLGQFTDLFALLAFDRDDYHGILRGSGFEARLGGQPLALEERRDQLQKLLQVYKDSKKRVL